MDNTLTKSQQHAFVPAKSNSVLGCVSGAVRGSDDSSLSSVPSLELPVFEKHPRSKANAVQGEQDAQRAGARDMPG